jgi:uncharacterized protein with ParB-like and HNH nuclease domain
MEITEQKLQDLITREVQYQLPAFQRKYVWTEKEWANLWADISRLAVNKKDTHFMGSVVVLPINSADRVLKRVLIDGQQRMTTFFVCLIALRALAKEQNNEQLVTQIALTNEKYSDDDVLKLMPTEKDSDRDVFKQLINGDLTSTVGQKKHSLHKAYLYFYEAIRKSGLNLDELYDTILMKLHFAFIMLGEKDNPNVVFESLNSKGLALTTIDMIRNYWFMRIEDGQHQEVYEKYWAVMERELDEATFLDFIRQYINKDGNNIAEREHYAALQKKIKASATADKTLINAEAIAALQDFHRFFKYYLCIIKPENEKNAPIRTHLGYLTNYQTNTYPCFLLNAYADYEAKLLTDKDFIELLKIVDNLLMRRYIVDAESNQLLDIFVNLYANTKAIAAKTGLSFTAALKQAVTERHYPADVAIQQAILNRNFYKSKAGRASCKHLLSRLDFAYNQGEAVEYSPLQIEHIMPQTLPESWKTSLGANWKELHENYLHRLGNLTLTGYNAALGNSSFLEKKAIYSKSNLSLNNIFLQGQTWGEQEIKAREAKLTQKILELWPQLKA